MKVRVNSIYTYNPVPIDKINPSFGVTDGILKAGDKVKVVNKHGCPKANTMNHCYVNTIDGQFAGMVCCNSLVK